MLCVQFTHAADNFKHGLKKYNDPNKIFKKSLIWNLDFTVGLSDEEIEELSYGLKE